MYTLSIYLIFLYILALQIAINLINLLMKYVKILIVFFLFVGCTSDSSNIISDESNTNQFSTLNCSDDLPKARLTNNGTVNHDLRIFDENGNIIVSAFNIEPGTTTGWFEFEPQYVLFAVDNDTFMDEKVEAIMDYCMEFDMEIGTDDLLVSYDITTN